MSVTFYIDTKPLDRKSFSYDEGNPEVNLANGNAARLLNYLGYDTKELIGHVYPEDMEAFRDKLMQSAALDDPYLEHRVYALAYVVDFAMAQNLGIYWA